MAVKSQTFWVVIIAAGCVAVLPWGCASDSESEAHNNRGVAHLRKGEHDAAIRDLTKAIKLAPTYSDAHHNRAIAHFHGCDYDKAWVDVKECQRLGGQVHPRLLADLREASGREE